METRGRPKPASEHKPTSAAGKQASKIPSLSAGYPYSVNPEHLEENMVLMISTPSLRRKIYGISRATDVRDSNAQQSPLSVRLMTMVEEEGKGSEGCIR